MLFEEPVIQSLLLFNFALLLSGFLGTATQIQGYGKRALPARFGLYQQSFCIQALNHLF